MSSDRALRRIAVIAGGAAVAAMGVLAGAQTSIAATAPAPLSPSNPAPPTTSVAPSYAPTNPVDCTDPNNAINCQTPPIDSPMATEGTAAPGSPYRD